MIPRLSIYILFARDRIKRVLAGRLLGITCNLARAVDGGESILPILQLESPGGAGVALSCLTLHGLTGHVGGDLPHNFTDFRYVIPMPMAAQPIQRLLISWGQSGKWRQMN